MRDILQIPAGLEGDVYSHKTDRRLRQMHRHVELEFNLVTRGRAVYLLENGRYDLTPFSLLWLFPEQEHVLVRESADFEMWIAVFKESLLKKVCTSQSCRLLLEANPPGGHLRLLAKDSGLRLQSFLLHLAQNKNDRLLFNAGLAYAILDTWQAYSNADGIPAGGELHPAVANAARMIRDDDSSLAVEKISQKVGLSTAHLSRLFLAQTGMSLLDFRSRTRIERFLTAYGNGRRSTMTEAALQAGFGSYAQFHRVFKKIIGVGPRAFQRKLKIANQEAPIHR